MPVRVPDFKEEGDSVSRSVTCRRRPLASVKPGHDAQEGKDGRRPFSPRAPYPFSSPSTNPSTPVATRVPFARSAATMAETWA